MYVFLIASMRATRAVYLILLYFAVAMILD
jgi:hypothetical protein